MRRSRWFCLAIALFSTSALAGRALDPALPAYTPQPVHVDSSAAYLGPDGEVHIGGADHVRPIVERFNALFERTHPGVHFVIDSKGTTSAVPLLMFNRTFFGAMGRAANPIESVPYRKIVGADPMPVRVAHTADDTSQDLATSLAVYVNRSNPLNVLSVEQLARILSQGNPAGDISHWGQLGLKEPWNRHAIHPYGTPEYTGFGDYLQQGLLQHRALAARTQTEPTSVRLLQRLADDPDGITVAAIGQESDRVKQVALIGLQSGKPTLGTPQQVSDGDYPLGRWLYFYLRRVPGQRLDPLAKEYLRLVLSREGQAIIAAQDKGYIPLNAAQVRHELDLLEATP